MAVMTPAPGWLGVAEAAPAAWAPNKSYAKGARVLFMNVEFECRQAHKSLTGQEPPRVPALWLRPTPAGIIEWQVQTNYPRGKGVLRSDALYEAIQAHVSDSSDWTPGRANTLWRCASAKCGGVAGGGGGAGAGGCTAPGLKDGNLCDDGNACTANDACKSGKCVGQAVSGCTAPVVPTGPIVVAPTPPTGGVTPIPGAPPDAKTPVPSCAPGLILGAQGKDDAGQPNYASIGIATGPLPPGATCRTTVQFCDSAGNLLSPQPDVSAVPTRSSLVKCAALTGPNLEDCGIDPATVNKLCKKDGDCAAGEKCGVVCKDALCNPAEQRCGKLRADCSGIAGVGNECDPRDLLICPQPGTTRTYTKDDVLNQVQPSSTVDPTVNPGPPFEPAQVADVETVDATCLQGKDQKETKQEKTSPFAIGDSKFGLYLEPYFKNQSKIGFQDDHLNGMIKGEGDSVFEIGAGAGIRAGARVFGDEIDVVTGILNVSAFDCEGAIGLELKIFGETVAVLDTVDGAKSNFSGLVKDGKGVSTSPAKKGECQQAFKKRNEDASMLKKTLMISKQAKNYYFENGTNEDLCRKTNTELGTKFNCDTANTKNIDIPNAWVTEYKARLKKYTDSKTAFGSARPSLDARIKLWGTEFPFTFKMPDIPPIPVGPVSLIIAVDFFGGYYVGASLDLGVAYEADWQTLAAEALVPVFFSLFGEKPEVKLYFGPRLTAGAHAGIMAFAGVGIPGVAIGLEGQINLLDIAFNADARGALARVQKDDPRSLVGTDFDPAKEGPLLRPRKVSEWKFGYSLGAGLGMDVLNGQLNAALRVKVLFFKKTFRYRLVKLNGFHFDLALLSQGGAAPQNKPLTGTENIGTMGDGFAFNDTPLLTLLDNPKTTNWSASYPYKLGRATLCHGKKNPY